ncbi:MAG: hypothetical protein IPI49_33655 [Myxococcales bacterium]|nr:hypothetical protein [Myxococcales bacterium]
MVLVIVIVIGIYDWSGIIAVGAVAVNILMMLTAMIVFGATLTLPGIAAGGAHRGYGRWMGTSSSTGASATDLARQKACAARVMMDALGVLSRVLRHPRRPAHHGRGRLECSLQSAQGPIKGFAVMLLVGVATTFSPTSDILACFFGWYIAKKKGQMATIDLRAMTMKRA